MIWQPTFQRAHYDFFIDLEGEGGRKQPAGRLLPNLTGCCRQALSTSVASTQSPQPLLCWFNISKKKIHSDLDVFKIFMINEVNFNGFGAYQ